MGWYNSCRVIMIGKILFFISTASLALLIFVLNYTTPADAGPLGVLVVFISIYLILLSVFTAVIYYGHKLFSKATRHFYLKKPLKTMNWRKAYYYASVISLGPVIILGLGTVGQIVLYEIILVFIFIGLGVFYVSKRA